MAPLLERHCIACHGPDKAKGHFRLDTFESLLKPGSSDKPTLVPGQPEASRLYQLIVQPDPDERMPQKADALAPAEIEIIRAWITNGARFDGPSSSAPLGSFLPKPKPSPAPERYGQPWPVTALAFNPDGTRLIASGYHEITLWDPMSGTLHRRIGGMPERTHALVWQPGGNVLAIVGGEPGRSGEVLLADLSSNRPPIQLAVASDEMLCAAFSPDGERLAFGGADSAVRVFNIKSNVEVLRLTQHSDWVHAIAFSPDGRWLASAARDRTARVYDAAKGEVLSIFRGHEAAVESIVFNDEGTLIFSAGADRRIRRWETTDAEHAKVFAEFDSAISGLTLGAESVFIGLADGRVIQRRLRDGSAACEFAGSTDRVTALALHMESHSLATGSHDGKVRIFDLYNGEQLAEFTASPGLVVAKHAN